VARALADARPLEEVLGLALAAVAGAVGSDAGIAVVIPPDAGPATVRATLPARPQLAGRSAAGLEALLRSTGRAATVSLPLAEEPAVAAAVEPLITPGAEPREALLVPLRAADATLGGLVLLDPREAAGAARDLIAALAAQAAAGVASAAGARPATPATPEPKPVAPPAPEPRAAGPAESVAAVAEAIAGVTEEEELLARAVEALLASFPARRAEVAMRDDDRIRVRFARGVPEEEPRIGRGTVASPLHARVLQSGKTATITARSATAAVGSEPEQRFRVAVPLVARDQLVGSLLAARDTGPFAAQEVAVLERVGRHLGTAVHQTRLFRRALLESERLERKAAERKAQLSRTKARLSRSRWLSALGELAAGVAHDLNNALGPIVSFADLLAMREHEPEQVRTYANRILMAARDGAETVRRIQRFTQQQHGGAPAGSCELAEVVREAVELAHPRWAERRAGGSIRVEISVDEGLFVHAIPGELRQALLNLIYNAVDAMPGGGTLRVVGRLENGRVLLGVQDTGKGMPPEVLSRALEPFFTTKGARGTGLGLPEVYGIVRRGGGDLQIESWPGIGTTVLLSFVPAPPPPHTHAEPRRREERSSRPLRILLVDDNPLSAEATAAALQAAGHTVELAASAEEALNAFRPGAFDVVLSDLGLPGMSGWDLLEQLARMEPAPRLGVLTGWALEEDEQELRKRGIDLAFIKPVDPEELLAALG
jgi:signal transduction histidine kinase